jgi:hypothetical protein
MSYTPIIAAADLATKLYAEKINAITRSNSAIADESIDIAISEVKSYLSRFDLVQLFGDQAADTAATFPDSYLKSLVKDVAIWHLITLANVGIDLAILRTRYEDAIRVLRRIQQIQQTPDGWPLINIDTVPLTPGNSVGMNSIPKRSNNY